MANWFYIQCSNKIEFFFPADLEFSPMELANAHLEGESVKGYSPKITIPYDPEGGELADLLDETILLIVSEKMRTVIKDHAGDQEIEDFPIKITENGQESTNHPYFFLNIVGLTDAVDGQHTQIKFIEDTHVVESISNLTLLPSRVGNRNIFRLKYAQAGIFISEDMKNALESAGCTGIEYYPIETYEEGF